MLIDTHAHLTMEQYADLPDVLKRASEAGVGAIINASFDLESSRKGAELASKNERLYAAVGIHPHHADTVDEAAVAELRKLASSPRVVAIGETGLDYYENPVPREIQRKAYERHLELAIEAGLPVVLHGREAGAEMLEVVASYQLPVASKAGIRGVFHCFSEDVEYAKKVLDMGFYISFTGIITFKKADKAREVVKFVPMDRVMVETDCPYLAPQAYRGQRNEPSYVRLVAQKVAEIKSITFEEVEKVTTDNARILFGIT